MTGKNVWEKCLVKYLERMVRKLRKMTKKMTRWDGSNLRVNFEATRSKHTRNSPSRKLTKNFPTNILQYYLPGISFSQFSSTCSLRANWKWNDPNQRHVVCISCVILTWISGHLVDLESNITLADSRFLLTPKNHLNYSRVAQLCNKIISSESQTSKILYQGQGWMVIF